MSNIKVIHGNVFSTKQSVIVNTVNCVGVMGAGIALEFKLRFPDMYEKYKKLCDEQKIEIGKLWMYKPKNFDKMVLNFPTKIHWRYDSKVEYLEKGLEKFLHSYKEKRIESIAFPILGSQNGGINIDTSLKLMHKYLIKCDIPVEIYYYEKNAKDDLVDDFKSLIQHYTVGEFAQMLDIKYTEASKISEVIVQDEINSIMQLKDSVDLNNRSLEKIFKFAIDYKYSYYGSLSTFDSQIVDILRQHDLTSKEIKEKLHLDWDTRKITNYLKSTHFAVGYKSKNRLVFKLKTNNPLQASLF